MVTSPAAVPVEEAEKAGRYIVFFKMKYRIKNSGLEDKLKQNLLKFLLN